MVFPIVQKPQKYSTSVDCIKSGFSYLFFRENFHQNHYIHAIFNLQNIKLYNIVDKIEQIVI